MTRAGNPGSGSDWPEALFAPVRNLPPHSHLWIALSGGMDSVLLLHVAARLYAHAGQLSAIHVNHQLQANAGHTERFCQKLCRQLGVPLEVRRVVVNGRGSSDSSASGGIEEAARHARYQVFEDILGAGGLLLMAHHGDDQAETVLFRLLRGTGIAGLGGMPRCRSLGSGTLYRPMLDLSRSDLEAWAAEKGLAWVEDPSNTDERFDRNFLRQSIMPLLKGRWPSLVNRIAHSARSCREAEELAVKLAEIRFQQCATGRGTLDVNTLGQLVATEQKNLLRWWIIHNRYAPPSIADWPRVIADLINAPADGTPELRGNGYALRRYKRELYLVRERPALPTVKVPLVPGQEQVWGEWRLRLVPTANPEMAVPDIRVSTRVGGERLRPDPDGPSKSLKNWLQEQNIPPWERARLPLFLERKESIEEVVGAGDVWLSSKYCGEAPASGWRIVVERECN